MKGVFMATVQVRYIVRDVDTAIKFYCKHLGFQEVMHPAPAFAMLSRGDLRLVLSAPNPGPGGGQSMPDGTKPEPGGWTGFQSKSLILLPQSMYCAKRESASEMISFRESEASRSWLRTLQAIPSNCLSRS